LIHQHHYLGYRHIVGNHLKYIAFIDGPPDAFLGRAHFKKVGLLIG